MILLLESSDGRAHSVHQQFFAALDELLERSGFRHELLVQAPRAVLTIHEDGGDPGAIVELVGQIKALGQRMRANVTGD